MFLTSTCIYKGFGATNKIGPQLLACFDLPYLAWRRDITCWKICVEIDCEPCPCNWGWQPLQYLSHLIQMPLKLPPSCLELVILYASYMRINALLFWFPRTINLPQTTTHKIQPKMHQWTSRHGAKPTKNNSWCLSTFHATQVEMNFVNNELVMYLHCWFLTKAHAFQLTCLHITNFLTGWSKFNTFFDIYFFKSMDLQTLARFQIFNQNNT